MCLVDGLATLPAMIRFFSWFVVVAVAILSCSCFRTSTVIRIQENGSGEIIARYYFSPRVSEMLSQVEALGDIDIGEGAANFALIREILKPDQESLEADAENYGEGVVYSKHELGKDSDGWEGYTVVYAFEDIRKVRIDQNSAPGKAKEFIEQSGQDLDLEKGGKLTFELEGKRLVVHSTLADASAEEMIDEEQLEQAREMGVKPSEVLAATTEASAGMRAGIFLRIEPDIAETNAEHVTGNLIIMTDAELSKVMRDPDFAEFIDRAAEDPSLVTDESIRELYGKLEAMTIEMADEIEIRFPE